MAFADKYLYQFVALGAVAVLGNVADLGIVLTDTVGSVAVVVEPFVG